MKRLLSLLLVFLPSLAVASGIEVNGGGGKVTVNVYTGSNPISGADEGSFLMHVDTFNCVGAGITCSDGGNGILTMTVPGGAGLSGADFIQHTTTADILDVVHNSTLTRLSIATSTIKLAFYGYTSTSDAQQNTFINFRSTTDARLIGDNFGSHLATEPANFQSITASSVTFTSSLTVMDVIVSSRGALLASATIQYLNVSGSSVATQNYTLVFATAPVAGQHLFVAQVNGVNAVIAGGGDNAGGGASPITASDWNIRGDTTGTTIEAFKGFESTSDARGNTFVNFRSTTDARLVGDNFGSHLATEPANFQSITASSGVHTSSLNVMDVLVSSRGVLTASVTAQYLNVSGSTIAIGGAQTTGSFALVFASAPSAGQHLFVAQLNGVNAVIAGGGDSVGTGGAGANASLQSPATGPYNLNGVGAVIGSTGIAMSSGSLIIGGSTAPENASIAISSLNFQTGDAVFLHISSGAPIPAYRMSVSSFVVNVTTTVTQSLVSNNLTVKGNGTGALYLTEGSSPTTRPSATETFWADGTAHWPQFVPNAGISSYSVVGTSNSNIAGHQALWGGAGLSLLDGGVPGTGSGSNASIQNPSTGAINMAQGTNGYAIISSSGVSIGTNSLGSMLMITTMAAAGTQLITVTTGAPTADGRVFELTPSSLTLPSGSTVYMGALVSGATGQSSLNQGLKINTTNDAKPTGDVSILSGFSPGAAGATQQTSLYVNAASGTVSIGTATPLATLGVYNDRGIQRYSLLVTSGAVLGGATTYAIAVSSSGHFSVGAGSPTISSCGSSPAGAMISGTDNGGTISVGGTAPTTCVITFGTAYMPLPGNPTCTVSDNSATISASISSLTNKALSVAFSVGGLAGGNLYYICNGVKE